MWSNFTSILWLDMEDTVPITPFTRPCFVSIFLRNMTRAPIANVSSASRPAAKLLSQLSFSSYFWALLDHFRDEVLSILSIQTTLCNSLSNVESIWWLKSLQAFLVGNKQMGEEPSLLNSIYFNCLLKHSKHSGVGDPQQSWSKISINNPSVFCCSLIVNSSYTIVSLQMFTEAMLSHPTGNQLITQFWEHK